MKKKNQPNKQTHKQNQTKQAKQNKRNTIVSSCFLLSHTELYKVHFAHLQSHFFAHSWTPAIPSCSGIPEPG